MSSLMESICSLESELWVRRLVSVLGTLILTAANVVFMVKTFLFFIIINRSWTTTHTCHLMRVFFKAYLYSVDWIDTLSGDKSMLTPNLPLRWWSWRALGPTQSGPTRSTWWLPASCLFYPFRGSYPLWHYSSHLSRILAQVTDHHLYSPAACCSHACDTT